MKSYTLTGKIVDGVRIYDNPAYAAHALQELEGPRNNRFTEKIERLSLKRTEQQNKWLWPGIYTPIHAALYSLGNDHLTIEDVHEMMLEMFAPRLEVHDKNGEIVHGKVIRSSQMNKMQFSEYVEQIIRWAAQFLSINIITPDEWRMAA